MRHIIFLLVSFALTFGSVHFANAQGLNDDFEGASQLDWQPDACSVNTAYENPFQSEDNPSGTVMRYGDVGGQYANVRFDYDGNFDLAESHQFSLKIYVPSGGLTGDQPNQVSLKLQNNSISLPWSTQVEIIKPIILDTWQTVTFNFASDEYVNTSPSSPSPQERGDLNRLVIQVNGEGNTDFVLAYIDDFEYQGELGDGSNPTNSIYNELVWSDEFDYEGPVDAEKWHHQTQLPNGDSWFNGEVQHYTDELENSFVQDGMLTIMAKREDYTDQGVTKQFTSARLNSKFAFTIGRVVVRAKLPEGVGTWPAIWMLGKNISEPGGYWNAEFGTTGWPACGEIDIMEHWGNNQNYVQSAMHTPSSFGATENHGGLYAEDVSNTFHTYMLEWFPDRMEFSLDGVLYYTYEPDVINAETFPFFADQYILLNTAIEASIAPEFTESPFVIDYVRVYQESTLSNNSQRDYSKDLVVYPNPGNGVFHIKLPDDIDVANVVVYDILGAQRREVLISQFSNEVGLTDLPTGIYMMEFDIDGARVVKRAVKQ